MPSPFRFLAVALCAGSLVTLAHAQTAASTPAPAASAPKTGGPTSPEDAARVEIQEAIKAVNNNDIDGGIAKLTEAIKLNPRNSAAYVLRASLYCQKKMWTQAEADFTAAQKMAPDNVVLKLNLVELKFMQGQYDAARPGYLALESDPNMGDFAAYKVFLCDLAGGHLDVAQKELAAFNKSGENPSYYFSNAAWSIHQKKFDDAKNWLESASNIYPEHKNAYYAEALLYLKYLPLPGEGTPTLSN